jgi:hypothetical protein
LYLGLFRKDLSKKIDQRLLMRPGASFAQRDEFQAP